MPPIHTEDTVRREPGIITVAGGWHKGNYGVGRALYGERAIVIHIHNWQDINDAAWVAHLACRLAPGGHWIFTCDGMDAPVTWQSPR